MIHDYRWEEMRGHASPICRGRTCQKAHYRDGAPQVKMLALHVVPMRKSYLRFIYMCPKCKTVVPGWAVTSGEAF